MTTRRGFLAAAGATGAAVAAAGLARPTVATAAPAGWPLAGAPVRQGVFVGPDGTAFNIRSVGTGDLVVIHPSLGRGALDFDDIAQQIAAAGFRVISLDPRGIGATRDSGLLSPSLTLHDLANDVAALIRANGGVAHLIGHDFGNRVMRTLATDQPSLTRSITLWACGSGQPSPSATALLTATVNPATPFPAFKTALTQGFFAPGNDPTPWFTGWYGLTAQIQAAISGNTPPAQYVLGGSARMLILQGADDVIAPPAGSEALAQQVGSRATRLVIDNAGHCMVAEQPRQITDATIKFLRGGAGGSVFGS